DLAGVEENVASLTAQRKLIPPTIPENTDETPLAARQQAQDRLAILEQDRDQLLIQYEKDAPQVREAEARVLALKRYILRIPQKLENVRQIPNPLLRSTDAALLDAKSRLAAAQARESAKQTYLSNLKSRLENYITLVPRLDELKRNVIDRNVTVQQLQETYNNIVPLQDAVGDPIRVLSPATPPQQSRPNPPLYIAVGLVLGSLLAGIVALTRERMQDRVNTLEDAYRIAGAPTLGYIPPRMFGRNVKKTGKLPTRVMENYRIVRSNVLSSSRETPFRSLMVTSTGRGEGKSEVAANLAIAMASGGKKVLLVDAHLASPSVHERFGIPREPGLSEVLTGDADLLATVRSTEVENLFVLSSGERRVSLADGLGGGAMTRLHETMIEAFDLVIFDTPPMLPRSDALSLSATVETVVYVVKPGETTKTLMKYCLELLRHAHARMLGVVFTNTEFYEEAA
ncbi:polysaccharide biosynthesis tyrosine autokinase, partial [bacterium]